MGAGGVPNQMREIRDKIAELTTAYGDQLALYKQIHEIGAQEGGLIERVQLDRLLEVLQEKEVLLRKAGEYEMQIRLLQEQLVRHFKITSFSLPQLKLVASVHYQKDLASLEAIVSELIPVLEILEEQERRNEASLTIYLEQSQGQKVGQGQAQRANRAYGKRKP